MYVRQGASWIKKLDLPADAAQAAADVAEGARDIAIDARDIALAAQEAAEDARDIAAGYASDAVSQGNVPIYSTIAGMAELTIPAGIISIRVNGKDNVGDGGGGLFSDAPAGSPDTFTTNAGARTWYRVADIGFGRINIGAQPGPKSIKFFNGSLTKCSAGNYAVDFNALQAGLNSEYAIDIAGQKLQLDQTVVVTKPESMLMSSIDMPRNGSGDVRRSAQITVVDNTLALLFDVKSYNARFLSLRFGCNPANAVTTLIKGLRNNHVSDLDLTIKRCAFEYGSRHVHTFGRGLQFSDNEVVGAADAVVVLDWDPDWINNGNPSNDARGTAQRAYTITQIRQHGSRVLVKNTGEARKHIAGILIFDI